MVLEKLVFSVDDVLGNKVEIGIGTTLYKGTTKRNGPYFVEVTARTSDTSYDAVLSYDLDAGRFLDPSSSLTPVVPIENQEEFMKDLNEIYSEFSGDVRIKRDYP
jgi:hypothetical protein